MIALFTGLLCFGYRVGYTQSNSAMELQSRPVAPARQEPKVEQQAPGLEVEPEIRLENSPPPPGGQLFDPAEPNNPDSPGRKPLARQLGKRLQRPRKADSYLSFLEKTLPVKLA
jgi:hypothetical protein